MLLIHCPYCEEDRPELEFRHAGEAHIARPVLNGPDAGKAVAESLYLRTNNRGIVFERWRHIHGCGRFFNAVRHSVTDKFLAFYKAGEPRPEIEGADRHDLGLQLFGAGANKATAPLEGAKSGGEVSGL
ncbi:sarcosine oxidase subunit delta [Mangrovicella endophytica]|uniref:sarcosine oxidase subunit delta n=1 Tax=Mangrovicella endophytica TaxID=2066697 RepID=UPI000C9DEB1A|nr:sarcosine oxidase subunit delta [Mangrovicella endophytica]